jgi:transcription elongation GreA/GreB family factor
MPHTPLPKSELLAQLQALLQARLAAAQQELLAGQESLGQETKSTAGDKYETGRAMLQIELQKLSLQRDKVEQQLQVLFQIDPHKACDKVEFGALVATATERYLIAIGLGKVELPSGILYVISADSPIARALAGKRVGEEIGFQGRALRLVGIG